MASDEVARDMSSYGLKAKISLNQLLYILSPQILDNVRRIQVRS
jgi:hypothetical protein